MNKAIIGSVVAASLLAVSVTSASADRWHGRGYYHGGGYYRGGPGPVLGLLGAVVVGAATIATLPLRIVGDAVAPPPPRYYAPPPPPPPAYYGRGYQGGYYGDGY